MCLVTACFQSTDTTAAVNIVAFKLEAALELLWRETILPTAGRRQSVPWWILTAPAILTIGQCRPAANWTVHAGMMASPSHEPVNPGRRRDPAASTYAYIPSKDGKSG